MIGFNGGLIGGLATDRDTSLVSAKGVCTLPEQRNAKLANLWPVVTVGVAATGGTETDITDGGFSYRVHTFTNSGSFVVGAGGTVEYLVVAGGGGGGKNGGGGGGAGGFRTGQLTNVAVDTYAITVGTGGAGGAGTSRGTQGNNSIFSTITSTGGGGGGSRDGAEGTGGSGG